MKKIITLSVLAFFASCSQEKDHVNSISSPGGIVLFEDTDVEFRKDLFGLNENSIIFEKTIVDPRNTVLEYTLDVAFDHDFDATNFDVVVQNVLTVTEFPSTLQIPLDIILEAFNLSVEDIVEGMEFKFFASVRTEAGVFTSNLPFYNNDEDGVFYEENTTDPALLPTSSADGIVHAMNFKVSFYIPPPPKIRGTSFEEPFAHPTHDGYIRPDGDDSLTEGELLNQPNLRHVMHIANGTGVDDEIGFKSEFIAHPDENGFFEELLGVTSDASIPGSFIDGLQGYEINDVDGIFKLTFDTVQVPADVQMSGVLIGVFFSEVRWETTDAIRAYFEIVRRGSTEVETKDLVRLAGAEIGAISGKWNDFDSGYYEDIESYKLIVEVRLDSSSEFVYLDRMLVYREREN